MKKIINCNINCTETVIIIRYSTNLTTSNKNGINKDYSYDYSVSSLTKISSFG